MENIATVVLFKKSFHYYDWIFTHFQKKKKGRKKEAELLQAKEKEKNCIGNLRWLQHKREQTH